MQQSLLVLGLYGPATYGAKFADGRVAGRPVGRGWGPLGLIEVMKLYTTIESPAAGVVEAIVADDGALVEFNQPLFVIRPD